MEGEHRLGRPKFRLVWLRDPCPVDRFLVLAVRRFLVAGFRLLLVALSKQFAKRLSSEGSPTVFAQCVSCGSRLGRGRRESLSGGVCRERTEPVQRSSLLISKVE